MVPPQLIDSHCHLDFPALSGDHPALLRSARNAGVSDIVVPGVSPEQWPEVQALQTLSMGDAAAAQVHAAAGLHPWWVASYSQGDAGEVSVDRLREALRNRLQVGGCCALGECGLDGTIETPLSQQLPFFRAQLALAAECSLPVIVHAHGAHNEALQCLKAQPRLWGGVIHGFSGSPELARQYWRQGFSVGVGGTITYERAKKTRRAIEQLPWEALLLETDAPDMPLYGYQGEANTPLQLPAVAEALAQLRGVTVEEVAAETTRNTRRVFGF